MGPDLRRDGNKRSKPLPDSSGFDPGRRPAPPKNVLGENLSECCTNPLTGFYRDGSCNTGPEDFGVHTVCTRVDAEFLAFSKAAGNDLSTPALHFGFPGLKPGDQWCLCVTRWQEAFEAGCAPRVAFHGSAVSTPSTSTSPFASAVSMLPASPSTGSGP